MFGAKVNHFLQIRTNNVDIHNFFTKPSLSGNPFFQPLCALALLLCAWRLFRALGCGGVGEVGYMGRV